MVWGATTAIRMMNDFLYQGDVPYSNCSSYGNVVPNHCHQPLEPIGRREIVDIEPGWVSENEVAGPVQNPLSGEVIGTLVMSADTREIRFEPVGKKGLADKVE